MDSSIADSRYEVDSRDEWDLSALSTDSNLINTRRRKVAIGALLLLIASVISIVLGFTLRDSTNGETSAIRGDDLNSTDSGGPLKPVLITVEPSGTPSASPIITEAPSGVPTSSPLASGEAPSGTSTSSPTASPQDAPTTSPSTSPEVPPSTSPTKSPSGSPTKSPSSSPTGSPEESPVSSPTKPPTSSPTKPPTSSPTKPPTSSPTKPPTSSPTKPPTSSPTKPPTSSPTKPPTSSPTKSPQEKALLELLSSVALDGGSEFEDADSYQSLAFNWVAESSNLTDTQTVQSWVLACIYFATNAVRTGYTDSEYGAGNTIPEWNETNWLGDSSECDWDGIKCNGNGSITEIDLHSKGLTGKFPPEIALLNRTLTVLDISQNIVANKDEEMAWLGKLTALTTLDIHSCNFDYNGVPLYLANLIKLTYLDISSTLFFGPLSGAVFAKMSSLNYLDIGGNAYNSGIPSELASLPNLEYLYCQNSDLADDLSFISDLKVIYEMWLDFNPQLACTIPTSIGGLATLASLSLTDCKLTGRLPSELGLLTGMQQLYLSQNQLNGTVPEEISNLTGLTVLTLEGNNITGTIPDGVCDLVDTSAGVLSTLGADCGSTEITCDCCTCCGSAC